MSVPRATIHNRCRHGPARVRHAAPLHTCHPWGVGSLRLARLVTQRARSGDAGGLRRDIAAAAHTQKSSGSPGPPCSSDWSMIYYPVASGKTPSRPILIAGAPGSSPSDQTGAVKARRPSNDGTGDQPRPRDGRIAFLYTLFARLHFSVSAPTTWLPGERVCQTERPRARS